jgi:hypothetical protein
MMGMIGHASAGLVGVLMGTKVLDPLRARLISSAGALTCVKSLEMVCESILATISEQFTIADHFFLFFLGQLG